MKTLSLAVVVLLSATAAAGQTPNKTSKQSCWQTGNTQAELNDCAASDVRKAEKELERIYSALVQRVKNDPIALESLKDFEGQWLKYRDAQMKALHPHLDKEGSAHPMCIASELAELTNQRVETLRKMLKPVEGDVCSYSPDEQ